MNADSLCFVCATWTPTFYYICPTLIAVTVSLTGMTESVRQIAPPSPMGRSDYSIDKLGEMGKNNVLQHHDPLSKGSVMHSDTHRLHIIACGVLGLDIRHHVERLGLDASMEFLPGGLHATPHKLHSELQAAIDRASDEQQGDMIAIGYGICGRGAVGIHARNVPLIIPRVNDCIALFLGSDEAYQKQFAEYPGTYYIAAGWVNENAAPITQAQNESEATCADADAEYARLITQHGEENADAIRYFLNSWHRNYQRAAFIDTGVESKTKKYEAIARQMADEHGWKYETLDGTATLLEKLLLQRHSDEDVLIVPPHHVTDYDPATKTLTARPVWEDHDPGVSEFTIDVNSHLPASDADESTVQLGLGIDAGGTYTDVVLYNVQTQTVLEKSKSLTTHWDYMLGISDAMAQLDSPALSDVELVSVSTTLATNAIVEGKGQPVGLLIMPPYGLYDAGDISHSPLAVLDGQLEISGAERSPIDPEQIRQKAQAMIDAHNVGAFAVAGFASHDNPLHEQQVKAILRNTFDLPVTCGHEVSRTLNYRIRATTAALNARIIPCLDSLLKHIKESLRQRDVDAPCMVVCSNGSLMSMEMAQEKPIETILSGPAASVTGAGLLSGRSDAIVVDIGGTTTDTAILCDGEVRTLSEGASVGGWRTHVRALDLRTLGLGGDSIVRFHRQQLSLGPQRVCPIAWAMNGRNETLAMNWIETNLDKFDTDTTGMCLAFLASQGDHLELTADEQAIVDALGDGPMTLHQLAETVGSAAWAFLRIERLEQHHIVQRAGLTPTDLLVATGKSALWNVSAAEKYAVLMARLMHRTKAELADDVFARFHAMLVGELVNQQIAEQDASAAMGDSQGCAVLLDNLLAGGNANYTFGLRLHRPLIGIGAPVEFFLPKAAQTLGTQCVIPPHADVANAIGAIASQVRVMRKIKISPNEHGLYEIHGLVGHRAFGELSEATQVVADQLAEEVRQEAYSAGTRQQNVSMTAQDRIVELADGETLFVGRNVTAQLVGAPDLSRF